MNEMVKRAAPGLAVAGLALSSVWLLDPALHAGTVDKVDGLARAQSAPDAAAGDPGGGTAQSAPASGDCSTTESATGPAVMTEWGPVQVQVEFAPDGSICSVRGVAYPNDDPKSARINARAIPFLDRQASEVGTAFDSVSGATYTSAAYRESLQSILDQR